jgi:hypothetical protein
MAINWRGRDVTLGVVFGVPALVFLLVLAFGIGIQVYWFSTETSVGDVNRLIESQLASGATTEDVVTFLETNRIEHAELGRGGDCPYGVFPGLSPAEDTPTICGVIRGTTQSWIGDTDLYVYFAFDQNRHLKDHTVISFCACGF